MRQATTRFISMILALFFVVAAFVIFFDLIRPAYEEAQTTRADVISRESFVADQQNAIAQVQQLIQNYQSQAGLQGSVSQALPPSPDFSGALYQLNGIAAGDTLALQSFSVSAPSVTSPKPSPGTAASSSVSSLVKPLGTMTFQLKFTGSYEAIKTFVGDLENNLRVFDVQSISIQPTGTKAGADFYTVDLALAAYYQIK